MALAIRVIMAVFMLVPVTLLGVTMIVFALTLLMVVMIGEAVREAFDPKVLSRLR